jgi:hypothetical protein
MSTTHLDSFDPVAMGAEPERVAPGIECEVCVRNARRYMRLGKTCASALAVGGAGGVAVAFLVTAPKLTAAQWLGLLLTMQVLRTLMWLFVWLTGRTLRIKNLFAMIAPFLVIGGVIQTVYSIVYFPDHAVAAQSETWWWLVADGAGWGLFAAIVRELFFVELLEEVPPPRLWGPGAPSHVPHTPRRRKRKERPARR